MVLRTVLAEEATTTLATPRPFARSQALPFLVRSKQDRKGVYVGLDLDQRTLNIVTARCACYTYIGSYQATGREHTKVNVTTSLRRTFGPLIGPFHLLGSCDVESVNCALGKLLEVLQR